MKKCEKICIMLFKIWKWLFKNINQTPPISLSPFANTSGPRIHLLQGMYETYGRSMLGVTNLPQSRLTSTVFTFYMESKSLLSDEKFIHTCFLATIDSCLRTHVFMTFILWTIIKMSCRILLDFWGNCLIRPKFFSFEFQVIISYNCSSIVRTISGILIYLTLEHVFINL